MSFVDSPHRVPGPYVIAECADEELVRLLVAGNHDAMSVIFDRYYALLMRVALRIVPDVGEAEDVVSIAFTDFYRKAQLFNPDKGNLRTWLLQYIYGRSINRLQGLKSRKYFNHVELADVDPLELATDAGEQFRLSSRESKVLVHQVLQFLNEKQRRAVELICFDGLTMQEAATATGNTAGNVQHYYYRSLERLRALLRNVNGQELNRQPSTANKLRVPWRRQKVSRTAAVVTREVENAKAQIL
jgi:RNA polymerase sigma-70 factor (ECF subfamily)